MFKHDSLLYYMKDTHGLIAGLKVSVHLKTWRDGCSSFWDQWKGGDTMPRYFVRVTSFLNFSFKWTDAAGNPLYLYGDMAYPLHSHLMRPFKGGNLIADEHEFNRQKSACRQSVEWSFKKTLQLFAFLDFKKNQKVYLQPEGMFYIIATILSNCHSCIYGNQTSVFCNVSPPSLDEYLR